MDFIGKCCVTVFFCFFLVAPSNFTCTGAFNSSLYGNLTLTCQIAANPEVTSMYLRLMNGTFVTDPDPDGTLIEYSITPSGVS